jgi:hypothetical protein
MTLMEQRQIRLPLGAAEDLSTKLWGRGQKRLWRYARLTCLLLLIQDFGRALGIITAQRSHCPFETIGADDFYQLGAAL